MKAEDAARLSRDERIRMSTKTPKAARGRASHTHGGRSQAWGGFECGQPRPYPTKQIPGAYRVQMPNGRIRFVDPKMQGAVR